MKGRSVSSLVVAGGVIGDRVLTKFMNFVTVLIPNFSFPSLALSEEKKKQ